MKKRGVFCGLIVLLCAMVALSACTETDVLLGTVGGLEIVTDKVVKIKDERWNNIFQAKERVDLTDIKQDVQQRYASDGTFSVTQVNPYVLAFSRKQLNMNDERVAEDWLFLAHNNQLMFSSALVRLVSDNLEEYQNPGLLFGLPVKHMTNPQLLLKDVVHQRIVAHENVAYPLSTDYVTLKMYYQQLGVYIIEADDAAKTISLKLNPTKPEVFHSPEQDYLVTVKIVYIDAPEEVAASSSVKGYFKATIIPAA